MIKKSNIVIFIFYRFNGEENFIEALNYIVREKLTGEVINETKPTIEAWKYWIEERAEKTINNLNYIFNLFIPTLSHKQFQ